MVGRTQQDETGFLPWSLAMEQALYGPDGFYRAGEGPAAHFRTSVHASPLFATAVVRLLREVDEALGMPDEITLVDVGAGRGELLDAVRVQLAQPPRLHDQPTRSAASGSADLPPPADSLPRRLRLVAVEVAPKPYNLTSDIEWRNDLPAGVIGLLIANEWLDNVPCDVAEVTPAGWRLVEVAADGSERLGPEPDPDQQAWLSTWWPTPESSDDLSGQPFRAEIGLSRDAAWYRAVATLDRGVAIAVDYAHNRTSRPPSGTLTGYAHGRQTAPIPDGSCDITAHVALDSCAAAAPHSDWTVLATQRDVFHSLGMTGGRPDLSLASTDPRGYLRALSQASTAAELTDPLGLGGFGWLAQGVGVSVPPALARL
jgi:SAM-dependent MidA family methyltransferase